ncbi:unnamed protein product [Ectocarpus sp. 12 AP-2014]
MSAHDNETCGSLVVSCAAGPTLQQHADDPPYAIYQPSSRA